MTGGSASRWTTRPARAPGIAFVVLLLVTVAAAGVVGLTPDSDPRWAVVATVVGCLALASLGVVGLLATRRDGRSLADQSTAADLGMIGGSVGCGLLLSLGVRGHDPTLMFSGLVLVAVVGLGPALVLRRLHRRQLAQPRPVVARAAVGGRVETRADRRADSWTLEVGVPEDWVELPRRPQGSDLVGRDAAGEPGTVDRGDVDPDAWARQAADELLGGADADGRDELAQVLADHVRLSWERSSILSALYVPVPELAGDAVEGIAVLAALEPELGADLDGVRRTFGSDAIDRRRMFDAIELPLGPALSAHLVDLDAVAGLGEDVDGVTYWLTVPQASRLVSLMVQWREHRPGDEMKLEARSIAESLAFVRL